MDRLSGERCGQDILWPFSWSCWATLIVLHACTHTCTHAHTHTHTGPWETDLTLLCGDESLTAPVLHSKRPLFLPPRGRAGETETSESEAGRKDKVVPMFLPCAPSCSLIVVQYVSSVRPASFYSQAVKNGIISLKWCVTTKVVPCSQVFVRQSMFPWMENLLINKEAKYYERPECGEEERADF